MIGQLVGVPNQCADCVTFAKILWRLSVCFSAVSLIPPATGQTRAHVELRREMLSHYNKSVAPGFENSPIDVGFVYFSSRVQQFDESTGTLTVEGQLLLNWMDHRLKWKGDPNYDKINYITAMANDIWKPKINVFNGGRAEHYINSNVPVYCSIMGRILWKISTELHPVCTLTDLKWYPTDIHTCTISVGAPYPQVIGDFIFGEPPKMVDHGIRRSKEKKSPQWDLLNLEHQGSYTSAGSNAIFYPTDDFIFTVRRQGWPLLASFLPLMMCCTFLSWSSFALPLHGKQLTKRLSVATCSLFLSSVFLLVLINTVPGVGQKPPIIIKVNVCIVIMAFLAPLHTIVVSRVSGKLTTHMNALQKLPGRVQYLLGLNKAAAGGTNGLLANMESPPDSDQNHFQKESIQEDESDMVKTAYDRIHLILQITVLTLAVALICLV